MRTIEAAAALIREIDPDSDITPYCLRQWVLNGVIPHVRAGSKRLINVDFLIDFLAGDVTPDTPKIQEGTIRPVELKATRGR